MKLMTLVCIVAVLATTAAAAHSWYDGACCNEADCEPLDRDAVQVTSEGYLLPNGQLVPHGRERDSRDGEYHWCRYTKEDKAPIIGMSYSKVCFYVPKGGA